MKYLVSLSYVILFLNLSIQAQYKTELKDYFGTWRWVSGKQDTLLVKLQPVTEKGTLFRPVLVDVVGYHYYVSEGKFVEGNFSRLRDTISSQPSIGGKIIRNMLSLTFWDITYNDFLRGSLRLLQEYPRKAILEFSVRGERSIDRRPEPYPNARTVPNNIVLEKIE
ncbi:MAG: hypothetical protein EPO58_16600 [Chitinophagaceae bacterium]|nr:MAG: hypothetical protein EPO58_16600 [Chitinophagaceae bacterium]